MSASDPVIGIDLGTSNSVVAVVQDGKVIVIPDSEGRRVHPSVVSFHSNSTILVGEKAKRRRIIDPRNTIFSAKRLIGRRFMSAEVRTAVARMPYIIKEGPNQQPIVEARGRKLEFFRYPMLHAGATAATNSRWVSRSPR